MVQHNSGEEEEIIQKLITLMLSSVLIICFMSKFKSQHQDLEYTLWFNVCSLRYYYIYFKTYSSWVASGIIYNNLVITFSLFHMILTVSFLKIATYIIYNVYILVSKTSPPYMKVRDFFSLEVGAYRLFLFA